jgi:histone chaperone ASF1
MSAVSLLGVNVLKNPAKFSDPYEFEITFECLEPLMKGTASLNILSASWLIHAIDLEWKLTYVGSATS